MMCIRALLLLFAVASTCNPMWASDAYLVRFDSLGPARDAGQLVWADDVLFYNANPTPVSIRLLGVSNAVAPADPPALELPAHRVTSLTAAIGADWVPRPVPSLYMIHVDVPAGVTVESRDEYYLLGLPELPPVPLGKVSVPVFRQLTPANQEQVHLGTDLMANGGRINVGIFNAGAETAVATIEVRRTCDDVVVDARTVSVPANTLLQSAGLSVGAEATCQLTASSHFTRYTVVKVSQPSLTYVVNINENIRRPESVGSIAPIVGLSIAQNSRF